MKEAILIVSFGTTHLDTLEKTVCAIERDIQNKFPEIPCFRAFTSGIVRKRLQANNGLEIDSVEEALSRLESMGFTHVTVQPTLLLPGEEYEKVRAAALNAAGRMQVTIGRPLLWDDGDLAAMAQILKDAYPVEEDTILLGMGHGTSHTADSVYSRLRRHMNALGMELCTVEGSISFEAAVKALLEQPKRKVHLVPLLLVAGDHAKKDMSGEGQDTLKSRLTDAGFRVSCSVRGLGEIDAVRIQYCKRVEDLMLSSDEKQVHKALSIS